MTGPTVALNLSPVLAASADRFIREIERKSTEEARMPKGDERCIQDMITVLMSMIRLMVMRVFI